MSTNAIKHYNDLKTILLTYGLVSMAICIFFTLLMARKLYFSKLRINPLFKKIH